MGAADIATFDTLIDVRSPAEFALDHIPGAINCPVLDNEQRHIIGTLHKQQGAFVAKRLGAAMVAENLARHLRQQFAQQPAHWRALIYCWRGGLRSGSAVQWLRLIGWDAQQLTGGYKAWRRHVIALLEQLAPTLNLRVLCGATGSGKTRLLQALAAQGAQVLDLEALACHKGSLLGAWPGVDQPSQTAFETHIAHRLAHIQPARTLWVEAESARIGKLSVPRPLLLRMHAAPCTELCAPHDLRLQYLLEEYAHLGDDAHWLMSRLYMLKPIVGSRTLLRWQDWAHAHCLAELFADLMRLHYDPCYERSQSNNWQRWPARERIAVRDMQRPSWQALAQQLLRQYG